MHKIINVPPASEAIKRAASSVSYWVTTAEARLAARNTTPAVRATRRQSRRLIHHHAGSVARLIAPSSAENSQPICPGFSCHSLASCAATAGAVIRIPGAIAAKITIAASKRRDTTSPAGRESALSVRGVLDIVGRAPVKKASPRRILQGVIPTGIRKTPCCHGARGMRKSDHRCSVR